MLAHTWNIDFPEQPLDESEFTSWLQTVPEGNYFSAAIVLDPGGEPIAGFQGANTTPQRPAARLTFDYWGLPEKDDALFPIFLEQLESEREHEGALALGVWIRDSLTRRAELLREAGYDVIQVVPATRLYVPSANLDVCDAKLAQLQAEGLTFASIAQLIEAGYDWKRNLYDATDEMAQDVPSTEAYQRMDFEAYAKMVANTAVYNYDLMYVAMDGNSIVGYTRVSPLAAKPDAARTGLSGVRRTYRRRGIVSALKSLSIRALQNQGIEWLFTDNDETNPLLKLNLAIGFEEFMQFHQYGKSY